MPHPVSSFIVIVRCILTAPEQFSEVVLQMIPVSKETDCGNSGGSLSDDFRKVVHLHSAQTDHRNLNRLTDCREARQSRQRAGDLFRQRRIDRPEDDEISAACFSLLCLFQIMS